MMKGIRITESSDGEGGSSDGVMGSIIIMAGGLPSRFS